MRFLLIARHMPRPPTTGAAQRTDLLMSALLKMGDVDLIVLSDDPGQPTSDVAPARLLERIELGSVNTTPYPALFRYSKRAARFLNAVSPRYGLQVSPRIADRVQSLISAQQYDWVIARYLTTYAQCGLSEMRGVLVDVDDLPTEAFAIGTSGASPVKRLFYRWKRASLDARMKQLAAACEHIWVANPEHLPLFGNASLLPNIPYPFDEPGPDQQAGEARRKVVLFVGAMHYRPNQDAVRFFLRKIWPGVRASVAGAEFRVIGAGCPVDLAMEMRSIDGVRYLGYIDRLNREYRQSAAVVVPMLSGSGTNIKVLEAMRHGCACVISPFAAKGLWDVVKDGDSAFVASNIAEFQERTVELLLNEGRRDEIGERACGAIGQGFSVNAVFEAVREGFLGCTALPRRRSAPELTVSGG